MNEDTNQPGVELDVMLTAEVPVPVGYLYRPANGSRLMHVLAAVRSLKDVLRLPCLAYVIRHPSAGTILIDTGMHPDAGRDLRGDFGAAMGLLFRSLQPVEEPFDEQLRALDVDPSTVERVIMTHLHVDHTSGMRLLPNAEFICSREEWAATRSRLAVGKGYVSHHLPPVSRMELLDFDHDGVPYGPFAKTIDLVGDGAVRLIWSPGHTVGHVSVLLQLADRRRVLVVGDAAYTLRNIHERVLPMLTDDDDASLGSMREIEAFAKEDPEAILVPTHDPSAWRELRDVTASADGVLRR